MHELDHFVKHTLKVRGYVRYVRYVCCVNDFVLLADSAQELITQSKASQELARPPAAKNAHHPRQ